MKILRYEEIDSTQLEAKRLVNKKEIENGTIIIAKKQTRGIGTHGRSWTDTEGITFTAILKPDCNLESLENITIDIAKIIIDVFKNLYNINLEIKKPNDIMCNGKKIAGILTETKVYKGKVKYLFIGIGINSNIINFPEEIANIATSIKKEFNIEVDNEKVIVKILSKLIKT